MTPTNYKTLALCILGLCITLPGMAKTPNTATNTKITTTSSSKTQLPLPILAGTLPAIPVSSTLQADGLITGIQQGALASTYALFYIDTKVASVGNQMNLLSSALQPNFAPCRVIADLNATGFECGLAKFGINELYSYSLESNLVPLPLNLDKGVKQTDFANFRSPVNTIPGDSSGRVVNVAFSQPVSQFLIEVDAGQAVAPSIAGISFVASNKNTGQSVTTDVKPLVGGAPEWVGVQVAQGFTDLTIIPHGGDSVQSTAQGFKGDLITILDTVSFNKVAP